MHEPKVLLLIENNMNKQNPIKSPNHEPEKEEKICSCVHQHNWQPTHNDDPS